MQYRSFGSLNWKVSALGFGTMRLPMKGKEVNEQESIRLLRYAIDHGINYIDTAYSYHDGLSEVIVGKALTPQRRKKARIATKMPTFYVNKKEDFERFFNEQLKRLNTNSIDFYLLHSLNESLWKKMNDFKIIDWAEQKIADGKIGYLGFSFHDKFEVFKKIINSYKKWTFCQIQFNLLDENFQAGISGLKYAASKGLAVSIMEPLAGGLLSVNPPIEIQEKMHFENQKKTAAEWALLWVWNHPEVSVALSGMNTLQQVKENIQTANYCKANMLTNQELELINGTRELYLKQGYIGCTGCRYCNHCSKKIDIPAILKLFNEYSKARRHPEMQQEIKQEYSLTIANANKASNCQQCGHCEEMCPQHLPIRRLLSEAVTNFE